jgi:hypothetical protein
MANPNPTSPPDGTMDTEPAVEHQPRERACLCSICLRRTTWSHSGVCFVCQPLPVPTGGYYPDGDTAA